MADDIITAREPIPHLEPRKRKPPVRWIDESTNEFYANLATVGAIEEPMSFEAAKASPQSDLSMSAMNEEMDSLKKKPSVNPYTPSSWPSGDSKQMNVQT